MSAVYSKGEKEDTTSYFLVKNMIGAWARLGNTKRYFKNKFFYISIDNGYLTVETEDNLQFFRIRRNSEPPSLDGRI